MEQMILRLTKKDFIILDEVFGEMGYGSVVRLCEDIPIDEDIADIDKAIYNLYAQINDKVCELMEVIE